MRLASRRGSRGQRVFADVLEARKPIDPPPIVQLKVLGDKHRSVLPRRAVVMSGLADASTATGLSIRFCS